MVKADTPTVISAGYCSTMPDATKDNPKFEMSYNSAPVAQYQPQSNDCITIKRNGKVVKLSTNHNLDMISKIDTTTYVLETSALGTYAPQAGDVYTIKGRFLSHDALDKFTGKYILDISETSFIVSENTVRSYFNALPQKCVDGGQASMPPEADQQWTFLFNLLSLEKEDAPVTGDAYGYYPTSTEDVYINGKPVANIDKQVLRRRDSYGYLFFVCQQSENQNWMSLLTLNSLIVFDGTFIYKGNQTYPNNMKCGFSLNEVAFHKIGNKVNDYEVVNFRQYLFDSINNNYDANNYSGDAKAEVARILANLENDISEPETVKEVYEIYDEISARLASYDIDSDAASEYLNQLKQQSIEEIENYPVYDNYFVNEQEIIRGYISEFIVQVELMNNKREIVDLVTQTKTKINAVKVRKTVMVESVLNQAPGYEEFLCGYDRVSLNNFNLNPLTFHGDMQIRKNEDLNTNSQELNQYNSFTPSKGNDKGNVVFQFLYQPNAKPVNGANVMVVLRGIPLKGYKFAIDTNSRGCYIQALGQDKDKWVGGTSFIFVDGVSYVVEVGAIDLIEYDMTWLFLRVDGEVRYDAVISSVGICTNARVGISANDNFDTKTEEHEANDYEGTVTVSNCDINIHSISNTYCSTPKLSNESVSDDKTIYCSSIPNNIPYFSDVSYELYPSSPDVVKLTRNSVTTSIGDISLPLMAKISPTDYQIDIRDLDLENGDILTIEGQFSYFDDKAKSKESFVLGKMTLTYDSSTKGWNQNYSLDDYKKDAKLQLDYFVDLNDYDPKVALAVSGVISKGKYQISSCASQEEVDSVLNETKTKILRFKTILNTLKASAVSEIREYKKDQLNEYRDEEKREIENLKSEAILNISNALTEEEILAIVIQYKADVDALKTDAEYDYEELEEARRNGIQSIQNHYASLNLKNYSNKKREQLNNETLEAISNLKNADSIQEIDEIVKQYISMHSPSNMNGGLITIIVISSVAVLGGIGLLVFFLVRRRRKTV